MLPCSKIELNLVGDFCLFGYVKVFKPELKISQYETYKAFYCSVCKELGHSYSHAAQFLLNYDIVFFLILKNSLEDDKPCFIKKHCTYNPLKKCNCIKESRLVESSANLLIISAYHKLKDDLRDEKGFKWFFKSILYPWIYFMWRKARKREAEFEKIISFAMIAQSEVEKGDQVSVDAAAHPSANALGLIFSHGESGDRKDILYRLGYMVGRWVYIIDAMDDIEKDIKVKGFNPLIPFFIDDDSIEKKDFYKKSLEILRATAYEAKISFNLLDIKRNKAILENIINEGFNYSQACVVRGERGCKREKSL